MLNTPHIGIVPAARAGRRSGITVTLRCKPAGDRTCLHMMPAVANSACCIPAGAAHQQELHMHPKPWTCCCSCYCATPDSACLQDLACGLTSPAATAGRYFTRLQCRHSTSLCSLAPLVLHCAAIAGKGSPPHQPACQLGPPSCLFAGAGRRLLHHWQAAAAAAVPGRQGWHRGI